MTEVVHHPHRPTILCPLEFERASLARSGLDASCNLICCGLGGEGIISFAEKHPDQPGLIILAGLAGSLRPSNHIGDAFLIATAISERGGRFHSAILPRAASNEPLSLRKANVMTVTEVVRSRSARIALAEKTGSDLVDLESAPFAQAGTTLGWRWAIIRGVSDDLDTSLPVDVSKWVNAKGQTHYGQLLFSLLKRPWTIFQLPSLRKRSRAAMTAVASAIETLLNELDEQPSHNVDEPR
ncbi:MAG: hypothetical protein ACR2GY_09135 [Phycisphaerales bacterium]